MVNTCLLDLTVLLTMLQMVFPTSLDSDTKSFDVGADMKRIGGPVRLRNIQEVQIKVYADHSAVEVFISSGEALTSRCNSHQQHASLLCDWNSYWICQQQC